MKDDMTLPQFTELVREQIEERNEHLKRLLREPEFRKDPEIPEKFRFYSTIVTPEGEVVQGKYSENYWRGLHDKKATKLDFEEIYFYAWQSKDPQDCSDEEIDFVSVEFTKFSFTVNGQEFFGYIDPITRHRKRCTIDP